MNMVLASLVAFGVFLMFYGLAHSFGQPSQASVRLSQYGTRPRTLEEIELSQPFTERVISPLIRSIAQFLARIQPQQNSENMRHRLELAGNPNNWTPMDFLGVRGLVALLVAGVVTLYFFALHIDPAIYLALLGAGVLVGFFIPNYWLTLKTRARQKEIQNALPDALDLLTISIEAGLGFDAAMAKVAEKWDNELSQAFGRAIAEVRVGKLKREALRDMANRTDVPDMNNFIAAVIQADQLGVSMGRVMRIQSEQMRTRRRQRAEEKARQAPVKMMFPLAFLIFPAILIVLLGPAVLKFVTGGGLGG